MKSTTASRGLQTLFISLALFGLRCAGAAPGINVISCGDLHPPGQYGPFDFRTITSEVRHRVEDYHFTPDVESGKKGATGAIAGGDLDYTLRAFPNDPRALLAVSRYVTFTKSERPAGMHFPAECYYERAIRFVPDDGMPHLLYAAYLMQRKRLAEMGPELAEAERLRGSPTNFDFDYNLGLLYFEVGAYDKSLLAAKRAYALGASFPALQKKLKNAGKWNDDPLPVATKVDPPDTDKPEPGKPDASAGAVPEDKPQ